MPRRKDVFSQGVGKPSEGREKGQKEQSLTLEERRLRQDLSLSKGERQKGVSPAYAAGKKVEEQERRRH